MGLCQAVDDTGETRFFCTLEITPDHGPDMTGVTHRTDYMDTDPDNPPFMKPYVHEWTVPA